MGQEMEVTLTAVVLAFWLWPVLLAAGYVAVASASSLARTVHAGNDLSPRASGHPAALGRS